MSQGNSQLIPLRIIPNSSKNQYVGVLDGALKIKITAPPIEGKANTQLIKFLAEKTGLSKSKINIASGATGKRKMLSVEGLDYESLIALLEKS